MKLVHPEWEKQIVFDFKRVPLVSIENSTYYYQVVEELYQQTEGKEGAFVLSDDGEILDFKSGIKKQVLKSKISALACMEDEIFIGDGDGVVYKFDKDLKLKGQKALFNNEIKRIFIDKGVLNGVNLDNEIKSLEINSF